MAAMERKKFPFASRHADLADWFEGLPAGLPFAPDPKFIRIEEFQENGSYVVQAELPGVDPEKDVELTVDHGVLTLRAERTEEKRDKRRSEFRYGSFTRSVTLPSGVDEDKISASYDNGLLTVKAPMGAAETGARRVEVRKGS